MNPKELSFRPLQESDFTLLQRWLVSPHVRKWWHEPLELEGVIAKYGPRVNGSEPTHVYIIENVKRPIGWIQWYRWSDYPDHSRQIGASSDSAGIDLAIGEESALGFGLGATVIQQFILRFIFVDPSIVAVITDPQEENVRSRRAFEKAGFRPMQTVVLRDETFKRTIIRLDRN